MKQYEVTREIYNTCAGRYELDMNFPDEVESDDLNETMKGFYNGKMPEVDVTTDANGSVIYTVNQAVKERYTFSEF